MSHFLETNLEIKVNNISLNGLLYKNQIKLNSKLIIFVSGFTNVGTLDYRFDIIKEELSHYIPDFDSLRFDFSGTGESSQSVYSYNSTISDLNSVVKWAIEHNYKEIILVGNSLGGFISTKVAKAYPHLIKKLILIGPLLGPMDYNWNEYFSNEQIEELSQKGFLIIYNQYNQAIKVDKSLLDIMNNLNQKKLLENLSQETLIFHGTIGEEVKLFEQTQKGLDFMKNKTTIKIIQGAEHGFHNNLEEITIQIRLFIR